MDELLAQFMMEAPELVQQAERDLLALERDSGDRGALDGAFRAIHTLKGSVALFDMGPLAAALHTAEDWLSAVRAKRTPLRPADLDPVLELLSLSEGWFAALGPGGALRPDAAESCRRLGERLRCAGGDASFGVLQTPLSPVDADHGPGAAARPPPWALSLLERQAEAGVRGAARIAIRYTPDADAFFRGEDPLALMARMPGLLALEIEAREPWPIADIYDPFRCNLVLTALADAGAPEARAALRLAGVQVEVTELAPSAPALAVATEPLRQGAARRLRVDPARVDALMEIADALAAASSAMGRVTLEGAAARELAVQRQQIARLVGELHGAVTQVRLAPLSRTFERLPRVVRELSARLGKPVRLEVEGEALEADRVVVDALFEPLLHLLRNALDHGLEDPAARRAAGKPAEGLVRLSAAREAGELRLEVRDDGVGVDAQAVRRSAVARGVLDPAALAALDDIEVMELLFAPGMSTSQTVSEVSGRGVGMDSVRQAVGSLGGRVALHSTVGFGTAVTLRLPVAASLVRLLTLQVGAELYGAPLSAVVEAAHTPRERLAPLGDGTATVWRGRTLPVLHLHDLVGLPRSEAASTLRMLVVEADGGERVGLVVDAFVGRTEGVLRPLTGLLAGLPGVLGTTLTPDGAVLFVLDLAGLIR